MFLLWWPYATPCCRERGSSNFLQRSGARRSGYFPVECAAQSLLLAGKSLL